MEWELMPRRRKDGGLVHPGDRVEEVTQDGVTSKVTVTYPGITIRDEFFRAAITGLLANPRAGQDEDEIVESALRFADKMLAARDR